MKMHETLVELLNAPEGERYQFKEWKGKGDFKEAAKICCALANCGGGKLVLGVTDKRPRKVVGTTAFPQPERTRIDLMDKLRISIDFHIYQHENGRILVFDVASRPIGLPVQADGGAWWYKGDSLTMLPEDVRREIYAEIGHDFSSDICSGATLQDLDLDAIEDFRSRWVNKSRSIRIKNLPFEQLLIDCEAITDKGITYAALILFGTRAALGRYLSQAEVIFEYRSKETPGQAQQREEFRVGFFSYYDRIWELVNLRNDLQNYQDGLFVLDIPTFNERVVRESLLNAVSHRNYQLSGSVFVRQYRDRLIVESPGGLPSGITVGNILNRQSPRNRLIATILALCGLVERSGQGMNLIYELSIRDSKSIPDFGDSDAYFVSLTLNGLILDGRIFTIFSRIGNERMESFTIDDFLIIDSLLHERKLTDHLIKQVKRLTDIGVVERVGRGRYVLARGYYETKGKSGVRMHPVSLDRESCKGLILQHLKNCEDDGSPLREIQQVLPNHSKNQVQYLLRELLSENNVFQKGSTTASRWFVKP